MKQCSDACAGTGLRCCGVRCGGPTTQALVSVPVKELNELLALPAGARFWSVDLHVHTPASGDMAPRWKSSKAEDLVRLAVDSGLEVIAVTDHNSAAWCDAVRTAAEGTSLAVFPGVEVSTSEGHLLAIFGRDKPTAEIEEFLVQIGIRAKQFGDLHAIASLNITQVAERVEAEDGVAIAAHVDRDKGFWKHMQRSATRRKGIHASPAIRAFEIVGTDQRNAFLSGSIDGYPRKVACVQGSDCFPPGADQHELDATGLRHCYLSMGEVSVSGLRQALLDPEIRVRLMDDERPEPTATVEGMWVSGGFFQGQKLRLNPNITCLIGGTGSGKSLSLELIRYALDQQVDASVLPRIADDIERLLNFALGELATVSVVVSKGGERYLIQRAWLKDPPLPAVFRLTGNSPESLEDSIDVPSFFPIRGFSQGEIIEFAREPLARLSLLDDLIDIDSELLQVDKAKAELRRNAAEILEVEDKLRSSSEQIKELPGLTEDVKRYSKLLNHPSVRAQEAWYAERGAFDSATEAITQLGEELAETYPEVQSPLVDLADLGAKTPSKDLLDAVVSIGRKLEKNLESSRERLEEAVKSSLQRLEEIRSAWNARFEQADEAYQEVIAKLDPATRTQTALHEKLSNLRVKESRLKGVADEIRDKLRPQLAGLKERRETLLDLLQAARKSIRTKRESKAKSLSQRLDRLVMIRVKAASDSRKFLEGLLELRVGSHLQEGDLRTVASSLNPVPFVKALIAADYQALGDTSELPAEVFQRFFDNVVARHRLTDLYELQLTDVEDVVRIQFAVETQTYRDLADLAHGQKCTVVLMIALAEGDFPLLVDQPEDALHAPWIEDYIVSSLRSRRGSRQCLFATRSANVLVSADAEQIVALHADAIHGFVDRTGALDGFDTRDLVLYHVEGGEQAFVRRQEKYAASRRS